jgi:TolA-binding protein
MRFHLLGLVLMAGVAAPSAAQRAEPIDKRVERLEQELRAVQRRVFPGGGTYVAPEIGERAPVGTPSGVPASSAVADLAARLDSLETQLAALTGQVEQNGNRLRLLEEGLARLRETTGARLDALEKPAPAAAAEPPRAPAATTPRPTPAPAAASSTPAPAPASVSRADAAEEAYNAGFRLWDAKRYAEAQQALEEVARRYPNSKWASWASNLAGRAYLDGGKPAAAARTLLANYQSNPRGERAADSLFYLGQALFKLNKPADACKAYDELQDVYGATMRDYLKQRLPAARSEAKCR